ncbi:MAG: prolyl oligopeptidase family serine peptidase [Myxococcota bacterium]
MSIDRSGIATSLLLAFVIVASTALTSAPSAAGGHAPHQLFATDMILWARVSPDGKWLALTSTDGKEQFLHLERAEGGERKLIYRSKDVVQPLYWVDDDTFLARFGEQTVLSDVGVTNSGEIEAGEHVVKALGTMVSALPLEAETLLWGLEMRGVSSIHRITVDDLANYEERANLREQEFGTKVAEIDCVSATWLTTPSGAPFAAHCWNDEQWLTYHAAEPGGPLRKIHQYDPADEQGWLKPMGPGEQPGNLIVTARRDRSTIGLYEYDPRTERFVREIFHPEDADVEYVRFDPVTYEVLSAQWNDGSMRRFTYLDSSKRRFEDLLGADDPPVDQIVVEASSAGRKRFVYWTSSPTEPGAHYFRDVDRDETRLVGRSMRDLDRDRLAPMTTFQVESTDGLQIEALLTVPLEVPQGGAPLVVMPHGGPIGHHDSQRFDPMIQYLASWGFAVLQANYRGSSGYGEDFQKAGRKQWARGIEDDLDAAFEQTASRPDIDASRACIIGGRYGGFSAVASAIRHPKRFQCVVSINGVSDVPFMMWDGSDAASASNAKQIFRQLIGDPVEDYDHLVEISPVYNVEALEAPVLVVYGTWDIRVPRDHSHRLIAMLDLHGKEYEEMIVHREGHSFSRNGWIRTLGNLRRFLEKHLGDASPSLAAGP